MTSTADAVMLVLGVLFVIISFLAWYRVRFLTAKPPIVRSHVAWRSGFFAWGAALISLGIAAFAGMRIAGTEIRMRITAPALYLLAGVTVFFLTALRFLIKPNLSGLGNSPDFARITRGFGLYLALVVAAAMAAAGFRAYQEERRS